MKFNEKTGKKEKVLVGKYLMKELRNLKSGFLKFKLKNKQQQ